MTADVIEGLVQCLVFPFASTSSMNAMSCPGGKISTNSSSGGGKDVLYGVECHIDDLDVFHQLRVQVMARSYSLTSSGAGQKRCTHGGSEGQKRAALQCGST